GPLAGVLRDRRERGGGQPGGGAALRGGAARHGRAVRAGRLRQQHRLVLLAEEPADGLPQDRRLLHAEPGARQRQPGHGHRHHQAGALAELQGDRRAGGGCGGTGCRAQHRRGLRAGLCRGQAPAAEPRGLKEIPAAEAAPCARPPYCAPETGATGYFLKMSRTASAMAWPGFSSASLVMRPSATPSQMSCRRAASTTSMLAVPTLYVEVSTRRPEYSGQAV